MKVLRKSTLSDRVNIITLDEAVKDLEGYGYWKSGTVKSMLMNGIEVYTPAATYKIIKEGI